MPIQSILVPQISSVPGNEQYARHLLNWLVGRNIVERLPTTSGHGGNGMAYAVAEGARRVVEHPERLPFGERYRGLEIVTARCIYTPTRDFLEEAGCPHCRCEIGVPLFASLEEWWPGETDNFSCPECGHEDDINGFLFLQPCAFSDLAFIFNGWAPARFRQSFLDEFAEQLDYRVRVVEVEV